MAGLYDFDDDQHFTLANIPFGVVSLVIEPKCKFIATRVYGHVYCISQLIPLLGKLDQDIIDALREPTLNKFASFPRSVTRQVREALQKLLNPDSPMDELVLRHKYPKRDIKVHLPFQTGDFTDFSCSMNHVLNASEAMTGKRSMPPCFLYFPPGYSGRCSSIVASGTRIRRPLGQYRDEIGNVVYGASRQVDFELEIGAIIGVPTEFGKPVHVKDADKHIFGLVLINDWSSRDIQALEMAPLGPLNGKSFGTTVSPWVVTYDALQPFGCPTIPHDASIPVAPYLEDSQSSRHFDITAQAHVIDNSSSTILCNSNFRSLYWSLSALVAHQTSNGCSLSTGDMLGTGTISGSSQGQYGCLLEATKGGKETLPLNSGGSRTYLQDGDAVRLTAWAGELGSASCVGFGESFGVLEGALDF